MKIVKVCFFIPTLRQGGGAARVILNLSSQLARNNVAVTIIVLGNDVNEPTLPSNVTLTRLNAPRALFSVFKLRRLLNELEADFVMSTMGHLNLTLALVKPFVRSRSKYIARESNTVSKRLSDQPFRRLLTLLYRLYYKTFDLVVAQSSVMADDLVVNFGVPADLLRVIGNPVDFSFMEARSRINVDVPEKKARFRIVTVGRHVAQKRFDLAIKLMGVLGHKYELLILGDGPYKEANMEAAQRLGDDINIFFVPFQMNPFPIISTADYYLITSEYEGLPNAALEALGLGIPVFGFNSAGGLPDYINDTNGCLVEFNNVVKLAEVISQSKLRKGNDISNSIREKLSADVVAQQYLDAFLALDKG